MEELFTYEEISAILMKATDPKYQIENLSHPTFSKRQICKISQKGLIFVHGNEYTGMKHINERHCLTSRKLYIKGDEYENPTKFNLAPIEYAFVADNIYTISNLNIEGNKRSELFEVYTGPYTHKEGETYLYTLILYKFTGIVHTFFISKGKPFNKK